MHYSIGCYVAKALPVKYQITFMHGMYNVAKTRFVTLLVVSKVLNSLEKLSWLQRRAFRGEVPHKGPSHSLISKEGPGKYGG